MDIQEIFDTFLHQDDIINNKVGWGITVKMNIHLDYKEQPY